MVGMKIVINMLNIFLWKTRVIETPLILSWIVSFVTEVPKKVYSATSSAWYFIIWGAMSSMTLATWIKKSRGWANLGFSPRWEPPLLLLRFESPH